MTGTIFAWRPEKKTLVSHYEYSKFHVNLFDLTLRHEDYSVGTRLQTFHLQLVPRRLHQDDCRWRLLFIALQCIIAPYTSTREISVTDDPKFRSLTLHALKRHNPSTLCRAETRKPPQHKAPRPVHPSPGALNASRPVTPNPIDYFGARLATRPS